MASVGLIKKVFVFVVVVVFVLLMGPGRNSETAISAGSLTMVFSTCQVVFSFTHCEVPQWLVAPWDSEVDHWLVGLTETRVAYLLVTARRTWNVFYGVMCAVQVIKRCSQNTKHYSEENTFRRLPTKTCQSLMQERKEKVGSSNNPV